MSLVTATRSLIVGVAIAASVLVAPTVQAHVALVQSTPAADTVVVSLDKIDLVFNETLVPRASRLDLSLVNGEAATPIESVETEIVNGKTLRAKLHHPLKAGIYRVQWRAVGDDNHPKTGDFRFTVK